MSFDFTHLNLYSPCYFIIKVGREPPSAAAVAAWTAVAAARSWTARATAAAIAAPTSSAASAARLLCPFPTVSC